MARDPQGAESLNATVGILFDGSSISMKEAFAAPATESLKSSMTESHSRNRCDRGRPLNPQFFDRKSSPVGVAQDLHPGTVQY